MCHQRTPGHIAGFQPGADAHTVLPGVEVFTVVERNSLLTSVQLDFQLKRQVAMRIYLIQRRFLDQFPTFGIRFQDPEFVGIGEINCIISLAKRGGGGAIALIAPLRPCTKTSPRGH